MTTAYQYSSAGDATEVIDQASNTTTYYQYNSLHEVTQETDVPGGGLSQVTSYTYDSAGNMLTMVADAGTSAAATTSYAYNSQGLVTKTIDPDGNTTLNGYDSGNLHLTSMAEYDSGGHKFNYANYSYDSAGNLDDTITAAGTTVDQYNGDHQLLSQTVYSSARRWWPPRS